MILHMMLSQPQTLKKQTVFKVKMPTVTDEYWKMDARYFLCYENEILELDESCDNDAKKDASCNTISDLRKSGINIPDIDELSRLPILSATRGLIGNVGNFGNKVVGKVALPPKENTPAVKCKNGQKKVENIKYGKVYYECSISKWRINSVTCLDDTNQYDYSKSGNTCQRKEVSQCKNGQDKSENLKYGKVYKKCIDFRWKTTDISCNKDTNKYDYYKKDDTCHRKNISECSNGQTKSSNIQYGEIKYKCSDYKWKFDKVSCKSDDKFNTYKASGQKCKREIKRACPTRDHGVMFEGETKSKKISGGEIITKNVKAFELRLNLSVISGTGKAEIVHASSKTDIIKV